jgi:hypothetical protein
MSSLRAAILAGLFALTLTSAARADQTITVIGPPNAQVTVSVTEPPPESGRPPILGVSVTPQPDWRLLAEDVALFQKWTGFRHIYSGRRYPF